MVLAAIETRIGENRKLPDFTFPPKHTSSPDPIPAPQTTPKSPPEFGFPLHTIPRNPTPTPTSMPEITSPLTPLSPFKQTSTFLTIPLEIRHQIYHYVLLSHPIHHAHLAPLNPPTSFSGMTTSEFHTTMLRHSSSSLPSSSPLEPDSHTTLRTLITTLSPSPTDTQTINALYPISTPTSLTLTGNHENESVRIQGKIPTGLLGCCRQVFEESKLLAWEKNTFTFINWFWSGVYASRQFTRGLRDWQAEAMRWVGVEVLARDLKSDSMGKMSGGIGGGETLEKGLGEWWELCALWKNVWGVRLGVKGGVAVEKNEVDGSAGWNGELGSSALETFREGKGILDVESRWVQDGLLKMRELRWIELEIEDADVDRETKIQFCAALEAAFNAPCDSQSRHEEGEKRIVKVILVERIKLEEKPVSNKDFVWYGGTAGDDSIWGLDM